jgi:gamma-glutamyltranspeptidase / glutathione hydrolase
MMTDVPLATAEAGRTISMLARMDWSLPHPSARQPVLADRVVATSQPLATQAGIEAMRAGGNAVDAAVAAAIALTVVEPTSNGIGGDAFAIVADADGVHGLNASGRSPAGLDAGALLASGGVPLRGWDSVTVPGAVSAWVALSERFGRLPLDELARPAVRYAREGYPVSPVTAAAWGVATSAYAGMADFAEAFLPGGRAPAAGERFALPDAADTLEEIAATGGRSFYEGRLAERIAAHAIATGGALRADDLAAHAPEWVATLTVAYGDRVVHELPPNGQGIAALIALGILARTDLADLDPDGPDAIHLQVEAMKLAFADAHAHVADPARMAVAPADLLADAYLDDRVARIDRAQAGTPGHGTPPRGGTVYLATADDEGRTVSLIQSNYYGFGSGIVVPGTGIALQNRGAGFTPVAGHPNAIAAGVRPFHTIIPALALRDGRPDIAFGVMGGPMQPQGHVQVLARMVDHDANPQAAADAPRWRVEDGTRLALEPGIADDVAADLAGRGHDLRPDQGMGGFGGAQIIRRGPSSWVAGSDHRKDGHAAGW